MQAAAWYQDWVAWSSIVAWLSFGIGLAPWIWKKLKKANPVLTPHTTISLCHRIGITNLQWFLRVENDGGADLDVTGIDFEIIDGNRSLTLPVASYYRNQTDMSVFAGFKLESGGSWQAMLSSNEVLPGDDMREYRSIITQTRHQIPMHEQGSSMVSEDLAESIDSFYRRHFKFKARSYEIKINLKQRNGNIFESSKYRYTLFETDVAELHSHSQRFPTGDGITWNSLVDVWLYVPVIKS